MKIETKLNLGDKIFFIENHKVIESIVQFIRTETNLKNGSEVLYLCNKEPDKNVNIKVYEEHAFKSKKDLIDSL